MPPLQEVLTDYATAGLSLKRHPVSFARAALAQQGVTPAILLQNAERYPHGLAIRVAGLVLIRQRPGTASGVVFITLEDETGITNLILWATTYDRYRLAARHATLLLAHGQIQRQDRVIHILAHRLFNQDALLGPLAQPSRDFH
jgi:error-prone DNA polymerase